MMELTAPRALTRSRFFRRVAVEDSGGRMIRHAAAILTEDQWGDWKGVLHHELVGQVGRRMIVRTPEGHGVCVVEDTANGQSLLIGHGPAPF